MNAKKKTKSAKLAAGTETAKPTTVKATAAEATTAEATESAVDQYQAAPKDVKKG
jgi:hypothetical protein